MGLIDLEMEPVLTSAMGPKQPVEQITPKLPLIH